MANITNDATIKTLYRVSLTSKAGIGGEISCVSVLDAYDTIQLPESSTPLEYIKSLVEQVRHTWKTNETTSESLDGLYVRHQDLLWVDDDKYIITLSKKQGRSKNFDVWVTRIHPDVEDYTFAGMPARHDDRNTNWRYQIIDPEMVEPVLEEA